MKTCSSCGVEKSCAEFSRRAASGDGLQPKCKACETVYKKSRYDSGLATAYSRQWREANLDRDRAAKKTYYQRTKVQRKAIARAQERFRKYGVTESVIAAMLDAQNGVCAACNLPETATQNGTTKQLHVDHDHKTGVVRGLLCSRCNTALGLLGDDPERILALVRYVTKPLAESRGTADMVRRARAAEITVCVVQAWSVPGRGRT